MGKYEAVIFDLDGVICHTDAFHFEAWREIAEKLNIPFDSGINDRLRGVSRMESLEILLEGYAGVLEAGEKEALAEQKNERYKSLLDTLSPADLSDEVKLVLKGVRDSGIKAAIGSSSKNTKQILEQLGLDGYFDAVSDGTNITRSKPDPEVFLKAAAALGIAPARCLVVEDASSGIQAAVSAGMDSAGIGPAARDARATFSLEHLKDLLPLIQANPLGSGHGREA